MIAAIALAAAVSGATQLTGALPGGSQYIMHRDTAAATAAIELWYRAPSAGYDNASPGIARLTIAALAVSARPHGSSLAEIVKRSGGYLSIDVYSDIAMIGANVPSWQAPAVLKALTSTYFSPAITDAGLKAALRDSTIVAAQQQYDAPQVLQNALFERLFAAGAAHYAPVPSTQAAFSKIAPQDLRAFAARALREQNAVLSIAGNVDAGILANIPRLSAAQAAPADPPFDSTPSGAAVDATVAAPVAGLGIAWLGPPIADAKAATAMDFIADYLFDPSYGALASALQQTNGDLFISGQFITLHRPGVLIATIGGANANAARAQVLQAAAAMSKPLEGKVFEAARNAFVYRILAESQTPASHADNAGWYAVEGDAGYAPGDESRRYLHIANSLDAAYVASVAAQYLQHAAIVQLLTAAAPGSST
ncbi:MAG: insulinase family protein [Candidatus Baltobacteraceae bacterium]